MTSEAAEVRHLFVYGTLRRAYGLLPLPARRMRPPHVLDEHGRWAGEAVLRGYALWDIGMYPGIFPDADGRVVGDLFDVGEALSMFDVLDRYEGIADGFAKPFEYRREVIEVEVEAKVGGVEKLKAWVYVYNWPVDEGAMILVPDGDYVKHSANGI